MPDEKSGPSSEGLGWLPIGTAEEGGTVCDLRFRDPLGAYETSGCFLHEDGNWYLIDPPTLIATRPTHWRPTTKEGKVDGC